MNLTAILTQRFGLSIAPQDFLNTNLQGQSILKNAVLLSPGQVCEAIYFIENGLARAFYIDDSGQEITTLFAQSGDFLYIPHSFLRQQPSTECLETIEPSQIVTIPLSILTQLYDHYPETNRIGRILAEEYLLMYDQRVRAQRNPSASVRIEAFMNTYPDIFARAPKSQIASYLGTTRESISRFLSQKAKKV